MALWLRGIPLSISAAIGFIALCGRAQRPGDDFLYSLLREQGMGLEQAVTEGALTRLRPVLMTALVACWALCPWRLPQARGGGTASVGHGGDWRHSLVHGADAAGAAAAVSSGLPARGRAGLMVQGQKRAGRGSCPLLCTAAITESSKFFHPRALPPSTACRNAGFMMCV